MALIGLACVLGMLAVLWQALKNGRTTLWFFGFANDRAERPVLYWLQMASYGFVAALIAGFTGMLVFASNPN